jgi:peroxiredoxin
MAQTNSTMLPLGTALPEFKLRDVQTNSWYSSADANVQSKSVLVMFICNHCPFVIHVKEELARIGQDYQQLALTIFAINSNDVQLYPADSPENMRLFANENKFTFPYLFDETQEVAHLFSAACTPDFFLFNESHKLVYRGQLDNARPGNGKEVTGKDLRLAMDNLLNGKPIPSDQTPSIGCNIKWKS